ncbi:cytochrome p450 [Moniliophthora roreri]|nr:cytochrome p450 [Moniliophthora roreri]
MLPFTNIVQVVLSVAISYVAWNILKRRSAYAIINKIPGPRARSWLKGHLSQVFALDSWDFHDMMRQKYGPTSTFSSLFGEKYIYTFDPTAMHHVLIKDQYTFEEQPAFILTNKLLFGDGLLSTLGEHHRKQRKLLNPVFSVAHMREMLPTFNEIALKVRDSLARKVQDGPHEVDLLSWMSRTALELVGQSGLGYSFDTLTDEEYAHPYTKALKGLLTMTAVTFLPRTYVLPWLMEFVPPQVLRTLSFYWPSANLHRGRDQADYMWQLSTEIYQEKVRALKRGDEGVVEQIGKGKDILSVLINENMKASDEDRLSEDELIGQMSTLIFAAMDTTSNALARTLLLLAEHPSVQTRLREELVRARENNDGNDLGYDVLVSLPYLDCVCRETLRIYPPVPRLLRTAVKDTVLPLATPVTGTDGSLIKEIPIPAHTNVHISILGSNRNTALWGPDALEWKPERWLEPLPNTVSEARIPGVMTFNGGGRSCIGFKFSQLEMKVVLAHFVETFEFAPSGRQVHWQYAPVTNPFVREEGKVHLKLPLKMSLVKKA